MLNDGDEIGGNLGHSEGRLQRLRGRGSEGRRCMVWCGRRIGMGLMKGGEGRGEMAVRCDISRKQE